MILVSQGTRHKPPSCGCIVLYDGAINPPSQDIEIVNIRFEHTCREHAHIALYDARYAAVLEKNRAYEAARQAPEDGR